MKKNNKGITLIALVVTIVIMLILAGITLSSITDNNSIIKQAGEESKNAQRESIIQKIEADLYSEKVKTGEIPSKEKLKEIVSKYGKVDKEDEKEKDSFTSKLGEHQISFFDIEGWKIEISEYIKVGEYVDYEPTKSDLNKKNSVDEAKLIYTSPIGTIPTDSTGIITHGNGYGDQTFTAKSNDEIKWRVLSVSDDKVELISENVVKTDTSDNFILKGGIGYLYAEQELNEVCKIYGYGYGADKNVGATYSIGGPDDTETKRIEGTGARSITIEDLNKIAGITEEDYTTLRPNYGTETIYKAPINYPILSSNNTKYPGQSKGTKSALKDTYYIIQRTMIKDANIQDMLFNGNYWHVSRCIENSNFRVRSCN